MADTQLDSNDGKNVLDRHLVMLRGYARHLTDGDQDADDLLQEVCVTVLTDPALLLRGKEPGAYLRGIARHLASRQQRSRRRERTVENLIDIAWDVPAEPAVVAEEEQRALSACLERLSKHMRDIISWRYQQGLNASEIAERLRTSSVAVRMSLSRARQALAKCVERRLTVTGAS
jgi:RNA polymerase sigma factor (sigma-70 family)